MKNGIELNSKKFWIYLSIGASCLIGLATLGITICCYIKKREERKMEGIKKYVKEKVEEYPMLGSVASGVGSAASYAYDKSGAKSVVSYVSGNNEVEDGDLEDEVEEEIELTQEDLEKAGIDLPNKLEKNELLEMFKEAGGLEELEEIEITKISRSGKETKITITGQENVIDFINSKFFNGENMGFGTMIVMKFRNAWMQIGDFFRGLTKRTTGQKPAEPESVRSDAALEERRNALHSEINKLARAYDEIQKNMESMFNDIFTQKALERECMLKNINLIMERRKVKVSNWNRFKDWFKSDDDASRRSGDGVHRNERMIEKDEIVDYDLILRIANYRKKIDNAAESIENQIKELRVLYDICQKHISNYNEKRDEFIALEKIKHNEGVLEYRTPNYALIQEVVKNLLDATEGFEGNVKKEKSENKNRSKKQHNKNTTQNATQNNNRDVAVRNLEDTSNMMKIFGGAKEAVARINKHDIMVLNFAYSNLHEYLDGAEPIESVNSLFHGFIDVLDALIDQMRDTYINEEKKNFTETFDNEARLLGSFKKMCKEGFFIQFYDFMETEEPPLGYTPNLSPFMFSMDMIIACKAYMASNDVVFGNNGESIKKGMKDCNIEIIKQSHAMMYRSVNNAIRDIDENRSAIQQNSNQQSATVNNQVNSGNQPNPTVTIANTTDQPCTSRQASSR